MGLGGRHGIGDLADEVAPIAAPKPAEGELDSPPGPVPAQRLGRVVRAGRLEIAVDQKPPSAAPASVALDQPDENSCHLFLAQCHEDRFARPEQHEAFLLDHHEDDLPAVGRLFVQGVLELLYRQPRGTEQQRPASRPRRRE